MAEAPALAGASPHRGEIYYVELDRARGAEIKKTRPAVVIQNDAANRTSPVTIVAALTSAGDEGYPTDVLVKAPEGGLAKDSLVVLNQIRTVDRSRLGKRIGTLTTLYLRSPEASGFGSETHEPQAHLERQVHAHSSGVGPGWVRPARTRPSPGPAPACR